MLRKYEKCYFFTKNHANYPPPIFLRKYLIINLLYIVWFGFEKNMKKYCE